MEEWGKLIEKEEVTKALTDLPVASDGWEWAIVEIFGHRRHAGRVREEEKFGAKLLRIDVPKDGDPAKGWESLWYGGASIFSFVLTTEAGVMHFNRPVAAPSRYLPPPEDDDFGAGEDE